MTPTKGFALFCAGSLASVSLASAAMADKPIESNRFHTAVRTAHSGQRYGRHGHAGRGYRGHLWSPHSMAVTHRRQHGL